jgi:hypothetical protein
MALKDTMHHLHQILEGVMKDLTKVSRGNKAAAQRVRTGTIRLEKVAKTFRKESVMAEKSGLLKKKGKATAKPIKKVKKAAKKKR